MLSADRIICGCGGTGRRARLRGVWATIWVQVPLAAPTKKDTFWCLFLNDVCPAGQWYFFTIHYYLLLQFAGMAELAVLACGLGHAAALTVHRTVIHYRVAASLRARLRIWYASVRYAPQTSSLFTITYYFNSRVWRNWQTRQT